MSAERNRNALTTAVEAWNAGETEAYLDIYSRAIVHHGLGPEPFDDVQNRAFYEVIWAAFPGSLLTIDDTVAQDDKLSARFRLEGEHHGEFMGIAPTRKAFVLPGQTIMRFTDAKIVERWTTSDLLGLMVQLGAVPPPAA